MSMEHPRRELDNAATPEGLRGALGAARFATPPAARLEATRQALLERAAAGATASPGASDSSPAASGATSGLVGKLTLGALATGLVAGALVVWQATGTPSPAHEPNAAPTSPAAHAPTTPDATPAVTAPTPAAVPEPTVQVPAEPRAEQSSASARSSNPASVAPEPQRHPRRAKRRARAPTRPPAARSISEIGLLSQARARLQDQPGETLRLATEHARTFPEGQFAQEREVLAVHALLRQGKRREAVARGGRFLARYPSSTHAQRVARLLEEAHP